MMWLFKAVQITTHESKKMSRLFFGNSAFCFFVKFRVLCI